MSSLRLLTWNVHEIKAGVTAVAAVIRAARADVVCLQEVPRWLLPRRRLARLGRSAGGLLAVAGGREGAGTALLIRPGLRCYDGQVKALPIPRPFSAQALRRRPTRPLVRPRGYATVRVDPPEGRRLTVVSMHLGLDAKERLLHVERVLSSEAAARAVVAGDLNEAPGGPVWRRLAVTMQQLGEGPTFPAHAPRSRLDAIFATPDLRARTLDLDVPDEVLAAASDHRPVLAQIDLG